MNQTMNRKFQVAFDEVIAQTVDRDDDIADERAAVLRSLGING